MVELRPGARLVSQNFDPEHEPMIRQAVRDGLETGKLTTRQAGRLRTELLGEPDPTSGAQPGARSRRRDR